MATAPRFSATTSADGLTSVLWSDIALSSNATTVSGTTAAAVTGWAANAASPFNRITLTLSPALRWIDQNARVTFGVAASMSIYDTGSTLANMSTSATLAHRPTLCGSAGAGTITALSNATDPTYIADFRPNRGGNQTNAMYSQDGDPPNVYSVNNTDTTSSYQLWVNIAGLHESGKYALINPGIDKPFKMGGGNLGNEIGLISGYATTMSGGTASLYVAGCNIAKIG